MRRIEALKKPLEGNASQSRAQWHCPSGPFCCVARLRGKQHSEPGSERPDQGNAKRAAKHGAQADELHLRPLELIARLAALEPPPRAHRHRYYGVLAPLSPLRAAAVALAAAQAAGADTAQPEPGGGVPATVDAMRVASVGVPSQSEPAQPMQPKRPAHYLWAVLIARIYEACLLLCPI